MDRYIPEATLLSVAVTAAAVADVRRKSRLEAPLELVVMKILRVQKVGCLTNLRRQIRQKTMLKDNRTGRCQILAGASLWRGFGTKESRMIASEQSGEKAAEWSGSAIVVQRS
jgi:hypothetical protein